VVLFYLSANWDESTFEDPGRFDVSRDPNRHAGLGGGGPPLLRGRLAGPHPAAGDLLRAAAQRVIHGVKRMDCSFTPTA
jgi:cytochrome P450